MQTTPEIALSPKLRAQLTAARDAIRQTLGADQKQTADLSALHQKQEQLHAQIEREQEKINPLDDSAAASLATKETQLRLIERKIEKLEATASTVGFVGLLQPVPDLIRAALVPTFDTMVEELTEKLAAHFDSRARAKNAIMQFDHVAVFANWLSCHWISEAPPIESGQHALTLLDDLIAGRNPFQYRGAAK